jgi:hypothetical protein
MHQTESHTKNIPVAAAVCATGLYLGGQGSVGAKSTYCLGPGDCGANKFHKPLMRQPQTPRYILPAGAKMHPNVAEEWFRTETAQLQHMAWSSLCNPSGKQRHPEALPGEKTRRQVRGPASSIAFTHKIRAMPQPCLFAPNELHQKDDGQTLCWRSESTNKMWG